jgi:hypothetical protein
MAHQRTSKERYYTQKILAASLASGVHTRGMGFDTLQRRIRIRSFNRHVYYTLLLRSAYNDIKSGRSFFPPAFLLPKLQLSRHSDGLQAGRPRTWGSISDRGKSFFSSPQRPDRQWGPPSLLCNVNLGSLVTNHYFT